MRFFFTIASSSKVCIYTVPIQYICSFIQFQQSLYISKCLFILFTMFTMFIYNVYIQCFYIQWLFICNIYIYITYNVYIQCLFIYMLCIICFYAQCLFIFTIFIFCIFFILQLYNHNVAHNSYVLSKPKNDIIFPQNLYLSHLIC